MSLRRFLFLAWFSALIFSISPPFAPLCADTFGTGENQFGIEFVSIGEAGNVGDSRHQSAPFNGGAVPYEFRIAKFEISEEMIRKVNASTSGTPNAIEITIDSRGESKPATNVTWFEAARFVNWLNESSGYLPAYKYDPLLGFALWEPSNLGFDMNNRFRNTQAYYFLPSIHEWYKAAYYDPSQQSFFSYPNGKESAPIPVSSGNAFDTAVYEQATEVGPADILLAGGPSAFGTVGQGGNVREWQENQFDGMNDNILGRRVIRGGSWQSGASGIYFGQIGGLSPEASTGTSGFRVASIPEPSSTFLLLIVFLNVVLEVVPVTVESRRFSDG
jgi:formylglycine-generating enzyme